MKIAFITNLPSHFHIKTFETLAAHYETDFFFFSDGNESWTEQKNEKNIGSFTAYSVRGIRITSRLRINIGLVVKLFKGRYDVFIQAISGRFELAATYFIARILGKPFILWTNLWFHPQTLFHKLTFPVMRYIYKHADALVVYGYHVKDYLLTLGVDEKKISYSWNVTDNSLFDAKIHESEIAKLKDRYNLNGRNVLLYVGRLVKDKGLEYFMEVLRQIPADLKVSTLIIGEGPLRGYLQKQIEEFQLQNVYLLNYVHNRGLVSYYASADVFVLPSITTETFKEPWGIVLNEAMNQGCPVIATDAVGAAVGGLVQQGKNGIVVPERDTNALANAIKEIFSDQEKLMEMKEFTRREIKQWDEHKSFAGFDKAIKFVTKSSHDR